MTFDDTPLKRTCIAYGCNRPAIDPLGKGNKVHCRAHDPEPAPPPPPAPPVPIGQDPDLMNPDFAEPAPEAPPPLDPAAMEPYWDGTQYVLRAKRTVSPHVDRQELVDLAHRLRAAVAAVDRWLE